MEDLGGCFFFGPIFVDPQNLIFLSYTLLFSTPKTYFFCLSLGVFVDFLLGGLVINWAKYLQQKAVNWLPQIVVKL